MEFRDLKKQYLVLKEEIDNAILEVTSEGNYIMGSQVKEFEEELAEYVGKRYCISCANGTDALQLALMTWEIGAGDAVFVPDFTFFSSGEVVAIQGAVPIFVDVDCNTFNMDPDKLEKKILEVIHEGILIPKVIVAVDLFGCPADYKKIKQIAYRYNLLILEDGAQGFGGSIGNKKACGLGDIGTTSFFPAKPLGCYGDGGAIFTNETDIAELLCSYRIHGKGKEKYDNIRIGMNSRLDTIQAAILKVKLNAFRNNELTIVNQVADDYSRRLREYVKVPDIPEGFVSSWAQYTIKLTSLKERDALKVFLMQKKIPSMVYYPKPMHRQKAFEKYQYKDEEYNITNELVNVVLSLPMHPYLEPQDVEFISNCVIEFCNGK